MSMHTRHEGMPENAVLADNCPRCEEHARDPFAALDDSHLARLLEKIDKVKVDGIVNESTNDWIAINHILDVRNKADRLNRVRLGARSQAYENRV